MNTDTKHSHKSNYYRKIIESHGLQSVFIRVHLWLKYFARDSNCEVRMETIRAAMFGCLLLVGASVLSGCATTDQGKVANHVNDSSQTTRTQAPETRTTLQKIGHSLGWTFEHIFIWGASLVPPG